MFKKLEQKISLLLKYVKIDYFYYVLAILFFIVLIYKLVLFVINSFNFNFLHFSLFFLIITILFFFLKSFENFQIKKNFSSFVKNNWYAILITSFILYIVINLLYLNILFEGLFFYSTSFLLLIYIFLRLFWFKLDYSIFTSSIKNDDIFSFYTIYIVFFLFFFSYIFSFEKIEKYRIILVPISFWFATMVFVYLFNKDIVNLLKDKLSFDKLFKNKILYWLFALTILISISFFSLYGWKILNIFSQKEINNNQDELLSSQEAEEIIWDLFKQTIDDLENDKELNESLNDNKNDNENVKEISYIKIWEYYDFTRFIWFGNTWEDVWFIQKILKNEWYYNWEIDEIYDNSLWNILDSFIEDKTWISWNYTQIWPKTLEIFKDIKINDNILDSWN